MKNTIKESRAVALVLSQMFERVDEKWPLVWDSFTPLIPHSKAKIIKASPSKFHFSLAVISTNMRALFDILPREQAERLLAINFLMFKSQFSNPGQFDLVSNTMKKYMDAYNAGLLKIENPMLEVAKYLYYNLGLENTRQQVVDRNFHAADPHTVEFFTHTLGLFTGFWDFFLTKFELVPDEDQ